MKLIANAGLTDFILDECGQHQILTNVFLQSFTFLPRNNPPEVSFDLYAENHQIPLTEFCDICMIPSDGSLAEPRPAGFDDFYRTLTVGDERGVSATTAVSLHFPAVHYFALFGAMCLLARKKVGALSAPDFVVLRRAQEGEPIAWELLWLVASILINHRVKYMVGFMLSFGGSLRG